VPEQKNRSNAQVGEHGKNMKTILYRLSSASQGCVQLHRFARMTLPTNTDKYRSRLIVMTVVFVAILEMADADFPWDLSASGFISIGLSRTRKGHLLSSFWQEYPS
jgi:hypothetical protein